MELLTIEEYAWLKKLQKLLDKCPSKRLGFYTIGDPTVHVYDRTKDAEITKMQDDLGCDFCTATNKLNAELESLTFPAPVHSTSG